VLEDAETEQYQNLDVKNWLDDLKHEIYELDHLLDVIDTNAQRKGTIRRFVSGFIKRFDSRIKELLKRLNVLVEQKNLLGLQEDRYEIQMSREYTHYELLVDEETVKGAPIINIVGLMGGRGKRILSEFVFGDPRIQEEFKIKVWVRVPESFDPISFTRLILESIHSSALDGTNMDTLRLELQQRLAGKKYFLIRDNVWLKYSSDKDFVLRFSGSSGDKMIATIYGIKRVSFKAIGGE
jgi:translation initiation factor RLI1